ncbi:hypothetical protein ScPMuIL_004055 [Solemya velum]
MAHRIDTDQGNGHGRRFNPSAAPPGGQIEEGVVSYGDRTQMDPRWQHPAANNGGARNVNIAVDIPESHIHDPSYIGLQFDKDDHVFHTHKATKTNSRERKNKIERRRTSSRKKRLLFEEGELGDGGGDVNSLPSARMFQRQRMKSLKDRKGERHDEQDGSEKTFQEKYSDLKESNQLSAGRFASLLRDTTLTRMMKKTDWKKPKTWAKFKKRSREFFLHFQLWIGTFRTVEGQFGTAIMNYFRFIRWLMFLNIYLTVITLCVITIPYLAMAPAQFPQSVPVTNQSVFVQQALECSSNYNNYSRYTLSKESTFEKVLDFLQGTGWMERTVLFYGVYFNKTNIGPTDEYKYDMSLAYMLAVGSCFVLSFILVIKNSAKNVKVTLGVEQTVAKYNNKIFAGWDFCVSGIQAAKLKKESVRKDIMADLLEQRVHWKCQNMTTQDIFKLYMIRLGINIFVLALLSGALYLIVWTTETLLELQKENLNEIVALIVQYLPYITISILNALVPIMFQKIVPYEKYSYGFALKITIARSVLLRLASLMVLMGSLYKLLIVDVEEAVDQCGNNRWEELTNVTARGNIKCWETYVGQQIYKLVLLDLIIETGIIFLYEFPRKLIYDKYNETAKVVKLFGQQEFDLPQSVIDITYSQTLCWLGMFFSPFIPLITCLKCLIFFYVKKLTLTRNCCPQERPYRTSRSNSLFMLVLLLSFILAAVPIGYMVGKIPPSQSCGPYRVYSSSEFVMFDTITNTVGSWPHTAGDIFYFFGTAGFLIPVLILLGFAMYYYWLLKEGYKKTEKLLKQQLKLEAQDKKYLHGRVLHILKQIDSSAAISAPS